MHIGRAIRTIRLEKGLSTRDIGAAIGASHGTIAFAERQAYPRMQEATMRAMCEHLGVSVEALMLRGLLGPTRSMDDQMRVAVAESMRTMTPDELTRLWSLSREIEQIRDRASKPMPTPDTHYVDRIIDPALRSANKKPPPDPPSAQRRRPA